MQSHQGLGVQHMNFEGTQFSLEHHHPDFWAQMCDLLDQIRYENMMQSHEPRFRNKDTTIRK